MRMRTLVPLTAIAAAVVAAPRAFKRAWRPPERPVHQTPEDFELDSQQVWITGANDSTLHGWFIGAEAPAPAVIVLHGWGGNAAHMLELAPSIHDAGMHALFLDARSHGLSEEEDHMSMIRFAEDLDAAISYLSTRRGVSSIGVIGHSVGAAACIYLASSSTRIDAVVSVASFTDPKELMQENLTFPAPVTWAVLKAVESVIGKKYPEIAPRNRISKVAAPIMIVHGDSDEVVPIGNAFELASLRSDAELLIVPGGTHSDLEPFQPYFAQVIEFLDRHLRGP